MTFEQQNVSSSSLHSMCAVLFITMSVFSFDFESVKHTIMKNVHLVVVVCYLFAVRTVRGQDGQDYEYLYCQDKQIPIRITDNMDYNYPYLIMLTQIKPFKQYIASGFIINRLWALSKAENIEEEKSTYGITGANRNWLPANFLTPLYPLENIFIHPKYVDKRTEAKYNVALLKLGETGSEIIEPLLNLQSRPGYIDPEVKELETLYWVQDGKGGFLKYKFNWCPNATEFNKTCRFNQPPYMCLSTGYIFTERDTPRRANMPCRLNTYTIGTPLASGNQAFAIFLGVQNYYPERWVECGNVFQGQPVKLFVFLHLSTLITSEYPESMNNEFAEWLDRTVKENGAMPTHPPPRTTMEPLPETTTRWKWVTRKYYMGFCEINKEEQHSNLLQLNLAFVFIMFLF